MNRMHTRAHTRASGRKTLRRHLLGQMLAVLFAALGIVLLVVFLLVRPVVLQSRMEQNRWLSYYIAQALNSQLERHAETLKSTVDSLEVLRKAHAELDPSENRDMLEGIVQADNALENLLVLDLEGQVLFAPPSQQAYEGMDLSRSAWFVPGLAEGTVLWSAVEYTALGTEPAAVCVVRKATNLYVGFVRLGEINNLTRQLRMPDGTHVHVFDQHNKTVVGHQIDDTYTQTYAPHLPEEGFLAQEGHYRLFDGETHYYAEYFRLPDSRWTVAVMTTRETIWQPVWLMAVSVSGLLFGVIAAFLLVAWRSNRTWMREFEAIGRLLHRIAAHEVVEAEPAVEAAAGAAAGSATDTGHGTPALAEPEHRFTDFDALISDFALLLDAAHIAEEEAREKATEAELAEQAKNRFISNISQEIRNPLGGILGASDLLLFRETDPEKRERLRLLRQSAELLGRTMEDVLDIANLEGGRFRLAMEDIQIHRLLEDLVLQYAPQAEKKGLQLTLRWDRNLPQHVRGDGTRIRQVLAHLVGNAIKFTEEGIVRLSCHLAVLEETGDKVFVQFSVRDTGIGIPPEDLETIFVEFQQLENADGTKRARGAGLGLAVCRRLVAAMGGEIGVESEEGQGSLFWFTLPLDRQAEEVSG
jgi:signal transduction histidine kinase